MEKIVDTSKSINLYATGFHLSVGGYDVSLSLFNEKRLIGDNNIITEEVATVFMSPQLAKTLKAYLERLLGEYEMNIGPIPIIEPLPEKE